MRDDGKGRRRTGMEWLTEWLSWWGRRFRRGCVVPDEPRVCPLHQPYACTHQQQATAVPEFNVSRLLHYKYSQDLFREISTAESLGAEVVNCSVPAFFPEAMNHSTYIIYFKMENYDDDFTFHHIMKCFGLDLPTAVGYFEGVFQVTFRGKRLLLLGVPYSRFSPSMKPSDNLIIADVKDLFVRGQTNFLRHQQDAFTFSTALVQHRLT